MLINCGNRCDNDYSYLDYLYKNLAWILLHKWTYHLHRDSSKHYKNYFVNVKPSHYYGFNNISKVKIIISKQWNITNFMLHNVPIELPIWHLTWFKLVSLQEKFISHVSNTLGLCQFELSLYISRLLAYNTRPDLYINRGPPWATSGIYTNIRMYIPL